MKTNMKTTRVVMAIFATTLATGVYAGGGTAKPPAKGATSYVTPTLPNPTFSVAPATIHQFADTGIIQSATVSNTSCTSVTDPNRFGGTVTINDVTIAVPCNMVVQMPANTLRWAEVVNAVDKNGALLPSLALDGSPTPKASSSPVDFPSFELNVVGNIVGTQHVAGLMYISQQSLNGINGIIKNIDYTTGMIQVDTGNAAHPLINVQINDPNGRFGRAQSPDPRFSVDDENPTIHAATGYPMCVPRTDPATADDPLCPQKNRPKAATSCRNFSQAGVSPLPVSGELTPPAAGQVYCSQFVMRAAPGTLAVPSLFTPVTKAQNSLTYNIAEPTDPDVRQQAPFEVGDYVTVSGTLMPDPTAPTDRTKDYISAHTIEANVGIYTQPSTQPSYIAIGDFGIGTADPAATAINGVAQETQNRIFLEAETSDINTPVDIYLVDVDPATGVETNRWVTPYVMTGECDPSLTLPAKCYGVSGGISTQTIGAQPQRARLRATKAPAGLLSQPTRTLRVVARSLFPPIEGPLPTPTVQTTLNNYLAVPKTVANGLVAGQYLAPVFEFIFPEGVKPGDLVVPNDLWHLPFLVSGEGASTPDGVGPLTPTPW